MASTAFARPPFAVDDQDTQYVEHQRQPRRPREERNKISESTYNAYDNYLDPADKGGDKLAPSNNNTLHRATPSSASDAHGAIGDGLLAALAGDDSDDSDSEELPSSSRNNPSTSPAMLKSKNQALFEAAVANSSDRSPSPRGPPPPAYDDSENRKRPVEKGGIPPPNIIPPRDVSPNLHPQHQGMMDRPSPSPTPSITPPPAAPVQVQIQPNAPQPTRPIPAAGNRAGPTGLTINPPNPSAFQQGPPMFAGSPMPGSASPYGSPGFHMTPTPIPAATSTPIQPVFIQPIKPAFIKSDGENEKASVMSHDSTMPILRGDKEDYLPLRSGRRIPKVGEKIGGNGDDFWRRFSMVVKAEKSKPPAQKTSDWLAKNQRGGRAHRRWALCVGVFLLAAIIGGAVTGWWFTRNNPDHQVPETLGEDSAHHTMGDTTTAAPTPVSGKKTTSAAAASKTETATADDGTAKKIRRMVEETDSQSQQLAPRGFSGEKDVAGSSRRRRLHAKRSHNLTSHSEPQVEQSS